MADYFSDNEVYMTHQPLPPPSDTPYHSLSRRTSRYGTPSSEVPSSPVPFPPDPSGASDDERISVLDPRRFTPTLHASLVSEILNLRRELDSKHKCIEELETNLHAAQNENDTLTSKLSSSNKETRAARRQLQQLENGTVSAMEEMVEESEKVREANADLKQRLEQMQNQLRGQDTDSTRVHDMWAREKEAWAGEKQALERRVHVSESRLKLLLDELVMQESMREERPNDSEGEDTLRDSGIGHESDTASVRSSPQRTSTRIARHSRNISNASFQSTGRGYRMSIMSAIGYENGRSNGISLADELAFEEEDEELEELELDSDDFPENEMRARRALESRQSMRQDEKAKRVLGLSIETDSPLNNDSLSTALDSPVRTISTPKRTSGAVAPHDIHHLVWPPPKPVYVDRGYQPSPPPSPVRPDTAESMASTASTKLNETTAPMIEVEANQSRKRVSVSEQLQAMQPTHAATLVSTQAAERPLSPPETPKVATHMDLAHAAPERKVEMASVSTQTNPIPELEPTSKRETEPEPEPEHAPAPTPVAEAPKPDPPLVPITIPSIAIHAPSSGPPSPKEPVLPPGTKSMGTQTTSDLVVDLRSVGTQTDPIRIDKRLMKLPAHLLPSSVTSRPGTPEIGKGKQAVESTGTAVVVKITPAKGKEKAAPGPTAHQDLKDLLEKTVDQKIEDRYPGNNDNGPLAAHNDSILSRPFRTSSLFAGFDGPSSDEEDQDLELSDEDFSIPRFSARNVKSGRVFHNPPTPVPEEKEVISTSRPSEDSLASSMLLPDRNALDQAAQIGKSGRHTLSRQPSVRRSAMIHSGTRTHMQSRSPSQSSAGSDHPGRQPPFPVPTRSSSRILPFSKSEGSQSPTPRSSGSYSSRRPYGTRSHSRKDSVRKVRSAAAVQRTRSRSRSPPLPQTPMEPLSPELPPLPTDGLMGHRFNQQMPLSRLSTNTSAHTAASSIDSAAHQANVVDAIAVTMVGEWMWKYTRKRKGFGGADAVGHPDLPRDETAPVTAGGVRHKRWVWVSPYERSVLWSSKQPTTQSALIGKSGRKLTIQSVLDVADNTPSPRNAGGQPLFNRSILILTPARALKFTTASRERHYLWLTALSFLAHSGSPVPELTPIPPAPPQVEESSYKPLGAHLRRSHVRDSVRLAKNKANPVRERFAAKLDPLPDVYSSDLTLPDAASPPTIPRGPYHGRKRSSTGPGAPPPSVPFRSISDQHVPSVYSSNSSYQPSGPSSLHNSHNALTSTRTSEASTSTRQHFFDSMGTVRMEAFIDNTANDPRNMLATKPPMHRRRRGSSQHSSSTDGHRAGGFYDDFSLVPGDPFRGF